MKNYQFLLAKIRNYFAIFNFWLLEYPKNISTYIIKRALIGAIGGGILLRIANFYNTSANQAATSLTSDDIAGIAIVVLLVMPAFENIIMIAIFYIIKYVLKNPIYSIWVVAIIFGLAHGGVKIPGASFAFLLFGMSYIVFQANHQGIRGYFISLAIHSFSNFFVMLFEPNTYKMLFNQI